MLNPGSKPIGAVVISSAIFCRKCTYLSSNNKQNMKKVIIFFKNWLFNVRKKNAIKRAQQLANEQRKKFLVLNFNGKPTVISMQDIQSHPNEAGQAALRCRLFPRNDTLHRYA